MPFKYDPAKIPHAYFTTGPSLTEQEHTDSCDINKMIKNAHRGLDVRGNPGAERYGYDDTTLDGLTHRIQKEQLENELRETAKSEFTDEELKLIPESIKKKFGFKAKIKKQQNIEQKNDNPNDDKNVNKNVKTEQKPDPNLVNS